MQPHDAGMERRGEWIAAFLTRIFQSIAFHSNPRLQSSLKHTTWVSVCVLFSLSMHCADINCSPIHSSLGNFKNTYRSLMRSLRLNILIFLLLSFVSQKMFVWAFANVTCCLQNKTKTLYRFVALHFGCECTSLSHTTYQWDARNSISIQCIGKRKIPKWIESHVAHISKPVLWNFSLNLSFSHTTLTLPNALTHTQSLSLGFFLRFCMPYHAERANDEKKRQQQQRLKTSFRQI